MGCRMYTDFIKLKSDCLNCKACDLSKTRNNVVFGVGNEKADVLFIGEAPGENEDLSGEAFVGRGGKLLDHALNSVGLSRDENIFIANTVKCRPPKNRDPLPFEQEMCKKWLDAQIDFIKPKIIVCLGRISARKFIGKNFKISSEHGKFFEIDGRLVVAVLHPAAILRNPHNKEAFLKDFEIIKNKMVELDSFF